MLSYNTLATWCKGPTHWKRPWCWERLKAEGEGDNKGQDGWMASLTQWTWASSGRWWRTGSLVNAVHGVTKGQTQLSNWTTIRCPHHTLCVPDVGPGNYFACVLSCFSERQYIKKQRHYFANKGLSSQSYGFSSSHVRMWELDYKESWAPKNWCFWSVVLEKSLESLRLQGDPTSTS